jgi:hypothetical protein
VIDVGVGKMNLPYPDFKWNDIIDPDQIDMNNEDIVNKLNQVVDLIDHITDSIESGNSGANRISLSSIAPFASTKLQSFLQEVITRLQSTSAETSGGHFIGTSAITGVTGTNVSSQLASLKLLIDGVIR